jgi:uncharacterized integral membrane protein
VEHQSTSRGTRDQARLIGLGAIVLLAVLFAALNFDKVKVNWIIGTWETPLILVIAASVAVGWLLGSFSARRRRRR